ncbi:MAG TPA: hypothetical protein VHA10_18550 [Hypericibacter adhaerens]|jgi:hypothetical protein|uniref:hypothetical protein n=1 Tax=Hypericibacter adhaerens TaxID=2602016 RepID=UPI001246F525|nr:hypothetical protein [Hypericibacter adhaerens]HWA45228.1 hypothetical protein [Hypericibacter adhaerens]
MLVIIVAACEARQLPPSSTASASSTTAWSDEEVDREFVKRAIRGCIDAGQLGDTAESLLSNCRCAGQEKLRATPANIRRLIVEKNLHLTAMEMQKLYDYEALMAGLRMNCPAAYNFMSGNSDAPVPQASSPTDADAMTDVEVRQKFIEIFTRKCVAGEKAETSLTPAELSTNCNCAGRQVFTLMSRSMRRQMVEGQLPEPESRQYLERRSPSLMALLSTNCPQTTRLFTYGSP